jgi:hypothetical protein
VGYIYKVPLEAVQRVEESEINLNRLKKLVTGDDAFKKAMTSHSDPITLDGNNSAPLGKQLLQIIDGRHRIFICQRRNVTHIPAQILLTKKNVGIHLSVYAHSQCAERFGPLGGTREGWQSYANTLVEGVRFTVTTFQRGREGDKEFLRVSFDWDIGADARNDLSKLGPIYGRKLFGSLLD